MSIYDHLNDALDGLIQGEQKRIRREYDRPGGKKEWATQLSTTPSLWEQLVDATAYQGNGGGAQGKPRLPITAGIVDIINEATTWTREGISELVGTRDRNDIPAGMRGIIANITATRNEGLCSDWTKQLKSWAAKAREQLQLNPPHPQWARGARCPECGAKHAMTEGDDGPTKTPALAINWAPPEDTTTYPPPPWLVQAVVCKACDMSWFRGESLELLVDAMIQANQTQETTGSDLD